MPAKVWSYTIGDYWVIKKQLSYREKGLLGRGLTPEDAREVRDIAALLLLGSRLDTTCVAAKESTYDWPVKSTAV